MSSAFVGDLDRKLPSLVKSSTLHAISCHALTRRANATPVRYWTVTLIFNVLFIIMHMANYPGEANPSLYLFLVLGINVPWTLSCVRNYIKYAVTPAKRNFCVIYDIAVSKPFFRNHVLLMGASMAGFQSSPFFTLMLMDIINNSRILSSIILSITMPAEKIGIVFFTVICTVVIYAQFGVEYFEDQFSWEDEGCHSVVGCFWLLMYAAVPGKSLNSVMRKPLPQDHDFMWRIAYDLLFFVWVGILLFNVLTGLIVDAFGTLRTREKFRDDMAMNECFMCGMRRHVYDELGAPTSFEDHKESEHNLWK